MPTKPYNLKERLEQGFNRKFICYPGGVYLRSANKPASEEDIKSFLAQTIKELLGDLGTEERTIHGFESIGQDGFKKGWNKCAQQQNKKIKQLKNNILI